jgi:hypothetical protein
MYIYVHIYVYVYTCICTSRISPRPKFIKRKLSRDPEMSLNIILEVFDFNVKYRVRRTSEVGATLTSIILEYLNFM